MIYIYCPCCGHRQSVWELLRGVFLSRKPHKRKFVLDESHEFGTVRGGDIDG